MIAYKLTDENGMTLGNTRWGPGVTHTVSGRGELCGAGWIHVYSDPLLAVVMNPIHANFTSPRLWRCEVGGKSKHDLGLKSGWSEVTTVEEMPLPLVTTAQCVRFAILCAKTVCHNAQWNLWADEWLNRTNRAKEAARTAEAAARMAAEAAWAAAEAAARTAAEAEAAAWAAWAARMAEEAWAARMAEEAEEAEEAAAWAAWAARMAEEAEEAEEKSEIRIDLAALILLAIKQENAMEISK